MTTILLLLSLLLHVVAFYFIVVLYLRYSTVKNLSNQQKRLLEETESSMTSFLIEMKDENERLINQLKQAYGDRLAFEKNKQAKDSTFKLRKKIGTNSSNQEKENPLPEHFPGLDEIEDVVEINSPKATSFEVEAINLYRNGHTVEQIAKKLNRGKTEIELLLKFRQ